MAIRKEGAFFEIKLPNGKYSYGRILPKANFSFYNIYSEKPIIDINEIQKQSVLFINAVYKAAITKDRWTKIGVAELELSLQTMPLKFIEDQLAPGNYSLYNPNTGVITEVTKDKCVGLERSAVWEPEHIEERIIDHFEGRPNKWVEQLKIK
ncbi:immunity 26/phosphotriesterase HocA family protein [Mucilaginibacter polytrichastri]|uniref:Immunity protein 26 n=1 Tax=Mucilaginibacter polytrichastri TaxID=1302689 RepID=A0A1Q6A4V2_9SPHI|nr:immunity 26/phosphotriesterase HocA family protein [Mucilaginibacter polytrichastri]OKS89027.1 hypothetical protein RG47T_4507 [Mucilaginibacter polytrichastri]SFS95536.1 Immunity protein 26 [Mucilaginibacter polytrichastri]